MSYTEQAKIINNIKAVRAVANANNINPICILLPCHRVIGKDQNIKKIFGWNKSKKIITKFSKIKY